MWFIIAIISFFLLALAAVIDKFLLTKSKIVPISYAFYVSVAGGLVSSLLLFFESDFYFPKEQLSILIIGGASFYLAMFFLYLAVSKAEISKVNPLIVSLTPLAVFLLSLLLGVEFISTGKIIGLALVIVGSYFLSQVGLKKTRLTSKVWLSVALAVLMFAIANTFNKIAYNNLSFITAFVWLRWFTLAAALIFTIFHGGWSKIFSFKEEQKSQTKQKWLAFGFNQVAGGLGVILMQYAIKLGSVTVVTALNGLQFFFVMFVVYFLSKFYPRILQEDIARRFVLRKVLWSAVLFAGVVLILI